MSKSKENMGKQRGSISDTATRVALRPGDYELGSMQSRAAARSLVETKKKPRGSIQIILVSPNGEKRNGPLIELGPI